MNLWPFRRSAPPATRTDVERELSFHLEMRVRELIAGGLSPEDARREAVERFGDYRRSEAACVEIDDRLERRTSRSATLREFARDVAYACRILRRAPAFSAVAILTLALGIGANSAIFSVVHGVLLQSLPYRDADRLYRVRTVHEDGTPYTVSAPDFMSLRQDSRAFDQIEAYSAGAFTLAGVGEPREVLGTNVSDGLASMLGWQTTIGRLFDRSEFAPGHSGVAVLDYGFWQRQFGGDRGVLGRRVTIGGDPYEIIGVLAPNAQLPVTTDMYSPLEYTPIFSAASAPGRRGEFLAVLGHARPDVESAAMDADLRRVGTALQTMFPQSNAGLTFGATPLSDLIVGSVRTPLWVLLGAVGFVLLVACANVANLLLVRASARQQEIAVRAALGAGRGRLVRQLVTEALVLGLAGGLLGLAVAYGGTAALVAAKPADIPRLAEIGVNLDVVFFTLGVSLVTGLIFGLAPALQATGRSLTTAMRQSSRGGGDTRAVHRARATLIVAEMALAVVLLTGAGLLIRSFIEMTRVQPGFRAEQAMSFRAAFQGAAYPKGEQVRARVNAFLSRVNTLPGVTSTGVTTVLPLSGRGSMLEFAVDGAPPPPPNINPEIAVASATPGYFTAIGAELRRGRFFSDHDASAGPFVAVINDAAVRRWFPNQDPIGRVVVISGQKTEVVGVLTDVLQRDPSQPTAPMAYVPYEQRTTRTVRVVVRSAGDPMSLVSPVRAILHDLDPDVPLIGVRPLSELLTDSVARPRFYMSLLTLFAGIALALAATGIFGVMSYAVAQRAREIGIRIALGATSREIVGGVVLNGLTLAAIGAAIGVGASLALGRVLQDQLFGVALFDPITMAAVVTVLIATALGASALPARRAARLDPATSLR